MILSIHPKFFRILAILLALGLLLPALQAAWPLIFSIDVSPSTPQTNPDLAAAQAGVQAFYQLDYRESAETWAARVCDLSTAAGCQAMRLGLLPMVRAEVERHQVVTGSMVQPVALLEDRGNIRVWQLLVTLNHPWPGLSQASQPVLAEVAQESGTWQLHRILFVQENARFDEQEVGNE